MDNSIVERIKSIWHGSLYSLERELGIGNGCIARWDKNYPSVDKIVLVAEKLNVSTDYLLLGVKTTLSEEEKKLVSLISELTDEETKELSNFVDYLISKRK